MSKESKIKIGMNKAAGLMIKSILTQRSVMEVLDDQNKKITNLIKGFKLE